MEINDEDAATSAVSLSGEITRPFNQTLTGDLSSLVDGDVSTVLTLTDLGNVSDPFRLDLFKATGVSEAQIDGSVNIAQGRKSIWT